MSGDSTSDSGGFPLTAWAFIRAAADRQHPDYAAAINRFVARYWKPVFCFLRARGHSLPQAEDLTQEFFERLLERDWLGRAEEGRGRFRTFLLTILVRFLSDQGPVRAPRQKAFEEQFVPIAARMGDEERGFEPPSGETPEAVFFKRWAAERLANARRRLQRVCTEQDRSAWYDLFEAAYGDEDQATQEALAGRFALTRDQVRHALGQTRNWCRSALHAEVQAEVGPDADLEDEVRELRALLER